MLQGPIEEEGRLFLHPFRDGMGHCEVGLGAPGTVLHAVLIVHVADISIKEKRTRQVALMNIYTDEFLKIESSYILKG